MKEKKKDKFTRTRLDSFFEVLVTRYLSSNTFGDGIYSFIKFVNCLIERDRNSVNQVLTCSFGERLLHDDRLDLSLDSRSSWGATVATDCWRSAFRPYLIESTNTREPNSLVTSTCDRIKRNPKNRGRTACTLS